ncbi:protein SirB1 [Klebsiella pneumoniae]|nr:protein SirB1 [Klebsiella pneumoniae]
MGSLADFEFNKAPLCDGMVLISEQVRDDFPSRFVEEELQRLLRLAQEEIAPSWDQERQIERLLVLWSNLNGHFDRVFSPRQGT